MDPTAGSAPRPSGSVPILRAPRLRIDATSDTLRPATSAGKATTSRVPLLRIAAALGVTASLAGCYTPELRDCTVSCASPDDCAGGQVCGSDGLCASPSIAGQCASTPADAGPDGPVPRDAGIDALLPDAPVATVSLRVQVSGRGSVVVEHVGTCSAVASDRADCTYTVPAFVARRVRAVDSTDATFDRWTSLVCGGQGATCTFTPLFPTVIAARFDRNRHASP